MLDPALVVTLGRHSMGRFMPGARISQAHGTVRPADPATGATDALVFAMYHPAAALRSTEVERTSVADIARVPSALLDARRRRDERRVTAAQPVEAVEQPLAEGPATVPPVAAADPEPVTAAAPAPAPAVTPTGADQVLVLAVADADPAAGVPDDQLDLF